MAERPTFVKRETLDAFFKDIDSVVTAAIREQMNKDAHVLIINKAEFARLVRIHLSLVRKVAARSQDEDIKRQLLDGFKRQANKLATRLYSRFIELLEAQIATVSKKKFTYQVERRNSITLYFFQGEGNVKDALFGAISTNVLAPVKKTLRENATRGSLDDVLSIIIAGVDIDNPGIMPKQVDDLGGQSSNLPGNSTLHPGNPVGIKSKNNTTGIPIRAEINKGAGTQLGHNRGPNTVAASQLLEIIESYYENLVGPSKNLAVAGALKEAIHTYDAEMRFNDIVYNLAKNKFGKGEVNISIIALESAAWNAYSGGLAGDGLKKLRGHVEANKRNIFYGAGSASLRDILARQIEDLFLRMLFA